MANLHVSNFTFLIDIERATGSERFITNTGDMAEGFHGIIKSVLSGDSVIVMGIDASKGPPPEKLLSLTGIAAPRLGNKTSADAPFAWGAREFLRRLAVGKRVSFTVEPAPAGRAPSQRDFGSVFFAEDGTSLAQHIVANGWAKPRPGCPPDVADAAVEAEAQGLGMYTPEPGASATSVRDVQWAGSFDPAALVQARKGRPLDAIIEQARCREMPRDAARHAAAETAPEAACARALGGCF